VVVLEFFVKKIVDVMKNRFEARFQNVSHVSHSSVSCIVSQSTIHATHFILVCIYKTNIISVLITTSSDEGQFCTETSTNNFNLNTSNALTQRASLSSILKVEYIEKIKTCSPKNWRLNLLKVFVSLLSWKGCTTFRLVTKLLTLTGKKTFRLKMIDSQSGKHYTCKGDDSTKIFTIAYPQTW
jgi:hypothetical protein